jgi:hypothetical protein
LNQQIQQYFHTRRSAPSGASPSGGLSVSA